MSRYKTCTLDNIYSLTYEHRIITTFCIRWYVLHLYFYGYINIVFQADDMRRQLRTIRTTTKSQIVVFYKELLDLDAAIECDARNEGKQLLFNQLPF